MAATMSGRIANKLNVAGLLTQHADAKKDGCLVVSNGAISWYFYLEESHLVYATYSADPLDLLDNHLRRLSHKVPAITSEVRTQVRINFSDESSEQVCPDYQAISWLVRTNQLKPAEAATLVEGIVIEILESYLLVSEGTFKFLPKSAHLPVYTKQAIAPLIQNCQQRLQVWQSLGSAIWSPHQRLYFMGQTPGATKLPPGKVQQLQKILRGFSFRHLGVLLNLDELQLAQNLNPLIIDKIILLQEPQPPFNQLPKLAVGSPLQSTQAPAHPRADSNAGLGNIENSELGQKHYTIACVDDSPAILNTINRYLQDQNVSVVMISDPVKALIQIMRAKPDLILLDVGMPWVDGYELCRLIRKNSQFKKVPVVMVTGNTGLIDRAKAKVAGATDYLTKPFTQADLQKMVFRHLT
ncbi:MAG: response regulator [Acaryochloridaceae cyanobacterium CSU_3_4]|nr:response regulator [Acaryochloridaceae cyanobacterium CSU_3_4]